MACPIQFLTITKEYLIKKLFILAVAAVLAGCATAQLPDKSQYGQNAMEDLKGTWVGSTTGFCGYVTFQVTSVDPTGTVRGTFHCKGNGWNATLGDKIDTNSMRATLTGARFRVDAPNTGGFDLIVAGTKMDGESWSRREGSRTAISLTKQ